MGVTADGWIEHAIRVSNPRSGGGSYQTGFYPYPYRIGVHEIQGSSRLEMAQTHPSTPHLWYDPATRILFQTVPLGRSSFALQQQDAWPHYTNKARCLQVELAGSSEDTPWEPDVWLTNIAIDVIVPCCQWAAMQGSPIDLNNVPPPHVIAGSASANAPQRFSWPQWADFNGICGHVHVPGNGDRWDPGALDLRRIAQHSALVIGGLLAPTSSSEDDVARLFVDPNRTVWSTDGVTAVQLTSPGYSFTRKAGLVPASPEWGETAAWAEIDHLLAYDPRTDSLRPIRMLRDPAAGAGPASQVAVVANAQEIANTTLATLKRGLPG